jgi:hypothetical protein
MKKQKSVRNLLMTALLFGGIFVFGAGNNVYAQDGGALGSGCCSKDGGGTIGSGTRTQSGGVIGSGTRTEDGGTIGSGVGFTADDGGYLGSGVGRDGLVGSIGGRSEFSWASVWELFF